MPDRTLVPLVAALSFLLGFGVADVTGVRPLGGAVLLAGGAWCAVRARPIAGTPRTVVLIVLAFAAFVASHPLGDEIGSWPAVFTMAALVAALAALLLRPAVPTAGRA